MGEQVQRLTKLATDLLDLSRLDAGGITVGAGRARARRARRGLRPRDAGARGAPRLVRRRRGRRGPALARGDEGRVLQVLRVLVDNAVRHTPPGSTVTLRTETTPWGASVIVSDDGPGIPPELLERVFERFFRGPGRGGARHGPRPRDRARAGRAHGRPAARHERARRHALRARAARPGRRRTAHRLHWVIVTARAALAGVAIALVAGLAGGALALALRGDGGERSVVTTVVRGGGARRLRSGRRSTRARATASSRSRRASASTRRRPAAASSSTRAAA